MDRPGECTAASTVQVPAHESDRSGCTWGTGNPDKVIKTYKICMAFCTSTEARGRVEPRLALSSSCGGR